MQVDYLRAHPDCRIVYTKFSNFSDIPEDELDKRQEVHLQTIIDWYLPSALIDIRLFEEIGMYDETMLCGEDTDWNLRLKFYKVDRGHCVDEVLWCGS